MMGSGAAKTAAALSWTDQQGIAARLAAEVRLGGVPQILVAISRGGPVPAVMPSHHVEVRDLRVLTVVHTADDGVHAAKTGTRCVCRPQTLGDLGGVDVLLADDIAGSGKTLAAARAPVAARAPAGTRSVALAANAANGPAIAPEIPTTSGCSREPRSCSPGSVRRRRRQDRTGSVCQPCRR